MNVLLRAAVPGRGRAGEVIEVSDAYARNFLLPKGLAVPATAETIRQHQQEQSRQRAAADRHLAAVNELVQRLSGQTIVMSAPANDRGTMFAALKATDIRRHIERQYAVQLPSFRCEPDHLKTIGDHPVTVHTEGKTFAMTVRVQPGTNA